MKLNELPSCSACGGRLHWDTRKKCYIHTYPWLERHEWPGTVVRGERQIKIVYLDWNGKEVTTKVTPYEVKNFENSGHLICVL